jgi:hypothetical protein
MCGIRISFARIRYNGTCVVGSQRVVFEPINWKGLFGAKELQGATAGGAVDVIWSSKNYFR